MKIIACVGKERGRCVIYGEVAKLPVKDQPVKLKNARMVLRWSSECGGLLGLAAKGPKGDPHRDTRLTHVVPETAARTWHEWVMVTDEAAERIDSWPAC